MSSLVYALSDGAVVAKRNLIKIKRLPEILVWTLISPIMFVVLFGYVFGSSIEVKGVDYREYFIAGIFAQTVIFGSTYTGVGLAEDMTKGIIDRFRSLPMARSAVLTGRTGSDVFYNMVSIFMMAVTGLVVGWRIHTGFLDAVGGFAILLLFAYSFSWIMAYVGLKVASVEIVNNMSFIVIFPLTFVARTFVDSSRLPGPLEAFANWNPVSTVAESARVAFGNTAGGTPDVWSLNHPFLYTLIWIAIILAVFIPLSVRQYEKTAARNAS